ICDSEGLRWVSWSDGDMPDDNSQVVIDDADDSLGLWYRAAPVAFLGRSLGQNGKGTDPYSAASLGTAILYGPHVTDYLAAYSRLAHAGAARIVRDADTLGTAVGRLIAPDLAASMAMAGWDTITEGAAVVDRVTELVNGMLDTRNAAQG
ncbi:MAG: 3-deoxy-D-manno-octulosonic acid transferase, partial [Pseudomonadota bacterium]